MMNYLLLNYNLNSVYYKVTITVITVTIFTVFMSTFTGLDATGVWMIFQLATSHKRWSLIPQHVIPSVTQHISAMNEALVIRLKI